MKRKKNLIIFTKGYPYAIGAEDSFIGKEIEFHLSNFKKIIIVPEFCDNDEQNMSRVDDKVMVFYKFSFKSQSKLLEKLVIFLRMLCSVDFFREIKNHPPVLLNILSLKKLVMALRSAKLVNKVIKRLVFNEKLDFANTVLYSYWFEGMTFGLVKLKKHYRGLKVITRCHGIDLYEERHKDKYLPLREITLQGIDHVFPISENGRKYLTEKHREYKDKIELSRLGVEIPDGDAKISEDGIFRVYSCSSMIPVKRLCLLQNAMIQLGVKYPDQFFEWHHLGDGEQRKMLENRNGQLPQNVDADFHGYVKNEEVLSIYDENPIDVFVNVSESEGLPVSIMEVMAYGCPVVASDVGGTSELVNAANGCLLLTENPAEREIAEGISTILNESYDKKIKRKHDAKKACMALCDLNKNYSIFSSRLCSL